MKNKFLLSLVCITVVMFTFVTVCLAEDTVVYEQNFDVADMTYSEFAGLSDSYGGVWQFTTYGYNMFYPTEFTTNDFGAIAEQIGTDKQGAFIENGRLKVMKKGGYNEAQLITTLTLPEYHTGQFLIKFDVELEKYAGYTTKKFSVLENETHTAFLGNNEYTLFLGHQTTQGQYPLGGSWSYFKDKGPVTVELLVDYDTQEYWAYCDGLITPAKKNFATTNGTLKSFNKFRFYTTGSGGEDVTGDMVMYLDNLVIKKLDKPEIIACNVSDGAVGTELTKPEFQFSVPVNKNGVEGGMKFYEGETLVEDAEFILSEDGLSLTLNEELKYSTPYRIEIDNTVISENKLYLPAESISFHTKHKPADLTLDSIAFINSDTSQSVSSLLEVNNVRADAVFSNNSEIDNCPAILILALYDSEGIMQQVKCNKADVSKAEPKALSVSMTLPENKTGLKLVAYMWNSMGEMEIIDPSLTLE